MCIKLSDVNLFLSKKEILNNINITFKRGFNLIYGDSGSGKTSLLKLINMLYSPSKGSIFYKEADIKSYDSVQWRGRCILTKQITYLTDGSVMDNILMPFDFKVHKNKTPDKNLMYNLMDRFHLNRDVLEKHSTKLSGGEIQRIAIIRAILLEPAIFLFDEPTSALDYYTEKEVFSYIKSLSNKRICIIASHSKEAIKYSDYTFKIKKGTIEDG